MTREAHYLEPTLRSSVPSRVVFVHLETIQEPNPNVIDQWIHSFRCATLIWGRTSNGVITRRHNVTVEDAAEFWDVVGGIVTKRNGTYLICDRMADLIRLTVFWRLVETGEVTWQSKTIGTTETGSSRNVQRQGCQGFVALADPPIIVTGRFRGCGLTMVGSENYLQDGIQKAATDSGVHWHAGPSDPGDPDAWVACCQSRTEAVESVFGSMLRDWKSRDCGQWGPTATSLAWNLFRRRHLPRNTVLVHNDEKALAMERWGYYGGQVLCNYIGEVIDDGGHDGRFIQGQHGSRAWIDGRSFVTDVNSLYPSVMRNEPLPRGKPQTDYGQRLSNVVTSARNFAAVAKVRICSADCAYPCRVDRRTRAAVVTRESDLSLPPDIASLQTIYATGEFWTVLCGEELRSGIVRGDVAEIAEGYSYPTGNYLASYVDELWAVKESCKSNGDESGYRFTKLLLNSITGRFARHGQSWVDCPDLPPRVLWGYWTEVNINAGTRDTYRAIGGNVQRITQVSEGTDSMPIVSACISAAGRVRMCAMRQIAGGRGWYYQDTDSIHCSRFGLDALEEGGLIQPGVLGGLRQQSVARHSVYWGPKSYYQDGGYVIAGRMATAVTISGRRYTQLEGERLQSSIATAPTGSLRYDRRTKRLVNEEISVQTDSLGWVLTPCIVDGKIQ